MRGVGSPVASTPGWTLDALGSQAVGSTGLEKEGRPSGASLSRVSHSLTLRKTLASVPPAKFRFCYPLSWAKRVLEENPCGFSSSLLSKIRELHIMVWGALWAGLATLWEGGQRRGPLWGERFSQGLDIQGLWVHLSSEPRTGAIKAPAPIAQMFRWQREFIRHNRRGTFSDSWAWGHLSSCSLHCSLLIQYFELKARHGPANRRTFSLHFYTCRLSRATQSCYQLNKCCKFNLNLSFPRSVLIWV